MRESLTSRRSSSASSRCICSARRRARGLSFAILGAGARATLQSARHLDPRITLDLVALLHVAVVLHANTAFGAGADLVDVVLEALQRLKRPLEDHHVVAQDPDREIATHIPIDDHAACHGAEL